MRWLACVLAGLAFAAIPTTAEACRIMLTPERKIQMGYETGTIRGAAIVAVEDAQRLEDLPVQPHGALEPWRASARILHRIEGGDLPETVEFVLGYGATMCETEHYPLPERGDLFAVYFWYSQTEQRLMPHVVMSLEEARRADPRVLALTTALRVRP